ncbi:MAG: S8 family serine peptidase [Candidatus Freyarchaeum deiterrae]
MKGRVKITKKLILLLIIVTLIFSASLFLAFNQQQQQITRNTLTLPNQSISTPSINSKMGTHLQYLVQNSDPSTQGEMLIFFDGTVNYTQGINLLKNLGSFEVISNYTIINGVCIKAPIGMAETIAQQNYIRTITYNEKVEIVPDQVTTDGVQAEDANANTAIGATTLQASPFNLNGTGVVVAVIDTGITPQLDLDGSRIIYSQSFVPGEDFLDHNGHGTAVAGIIGASGVNFPTAKGVAPAVNFLDLKALDATGYGQLDWVVGAINEAWNTINHPKADIVSMSLGDSFGTSYDDMSMAVNSAWVNNDTIAVVAAGNEGGINMGGTILGPYYGTISSPGLASYIITVGAFNSSSQSVAYFSSLGPTDDLRAKPDIVAPGVNLIALSSTGGLRSSGFSGTSAATPVVSGAIALLLDNSTTNGMPWLKLSPNTVKAALLMNAKDLGLNPFAQGAGLLNISSTYSYLRGYYNGSNLTLPVAITPIRALAYPMLFWDLTPSDVVLTVVVGNITSNHPIINASFIVSGNARAYTTVSSGVFSSLNDTQLFVPVSFIVPLWRSVYDFSGNLTLVNASGSALFNIPLALNDTAFVDWSVSSVLWALYLNDITNLTNTAYNITYGGIGLIALGLVVALSLSWEISKRKPAAPLVGIGIGGISPELQQLSTMIVSYCPYCGTKVEPKDFFCNNCGKQVRIIPSVD